MYIKVVAKEKLICFSYLNASFFILNYSFVIRKGIHSVITVIVAQDPNEFSSARKSLIQTDKLKLGEIIPSNQPLNANKLKQPMVNSANKKHLI